MTNSKCHNRYKTKTERLSRSRFLSLPRSLLIDSVEALASLFTQQNFTLLHLVTNDTWTLPYTHSLQPTRSSFDEIISDHYVFHREGEKIQKKTAKIKFYHCIGRNLCSVCIFEPMPSSPRPISPSFYFLWVSLFLSASSPLLELVPVTVCVFV